jgi:hypothetical protein
MCCYRAIQARCVVIAVNTWISPHQHQIQNSISISRATKGDWVGCFFLIAVVVCGSQITKLHASFLLRPNQLCLETTIQEIIAGLRSWSTALTLAQLLQRNSTKHRQGCLPLFTCFLLAYVVNLFQCCWRRTCSTDSHGEGELVQLTVMTAHMR